MANTSSDIAIEQMDIDRLMATENSSSVERLRPSNALFSFNVEKCENLPAAVRAILANAREGTERQTLPSEREERIFEVIEDLRGWPEKMFNCLMKHFTEIYNIDLHIISFGQGKFNKYHQEAQQRSDREPKMACLLFNKDHTVCGPLFLTRVDGSIQTAFLSSCAESNLGLYLYLVQLNDSLMGKTVLITPSQGPVGNGEVTQPGQSPSIHDDQSASEAPIYTVSDSAQKEENGNYHGAVHEFSNQILQLIYGLPLHPSQIQQLLQPFLSDVPATQYLSAVNTVAALRDRIFCLTHLAQLSEQSPPFIQSTYVHESQRMVPSTSVNEGEDVFRVPDETHLVIRNTEQHESERAVVSTVPMSSALRSDDATLDPNQAYLSNMQDSNSAPLRYKQPTLVKQLKGTHHPRTFKEFATSGSAPISCVRSGQREPVKFMAPSADGVTLYLGVSVVDINHQPHLTKLCVPDKTKVVDQLLMQNNDLRCLNFDLCPGSTYNIHTREMYSEISPEERQNLSTSIIMHMVNLYQRDSINQKVVADNELKKCMIAFWFATKEAGVFQQVSPTTFSTMITDSMKVSGTKNSPKKKKVNISAQARGR